MDFIIADLDNINLNELLTIMDKNHSIARRKSEEIVNMNNYSNEKIIVVEENAECVTNKAKTKETQEVDEAFESDIKDYLIELNKLNLENIDEKIFSILPDKSNYEFERIIYRLQLEVLKSINELEEFMEEEASLTDDDRESFDLEKDLEEKKLAYLKSALIDEKEKDEKVENTLMFVPTSGGNIRVLNELEKMPMEYYEAFLDLLLSIKDSTFKNSRHFINNANLSGVMEVKGFQTRILYERLAKNKYAIITAFIKKVNVDRGYLESIYQKTKDYFSIKENIKALLDNEEFLQMNKEYEEEIINLLKGSNNKIKEKEKQYE